MPSKEIRSYREFLKDSLRLKINFNQTDQNQGVAPPPVQKPQRPDQQLIELPDEENRQKMLGTDLIDAIDRRRSHRRFTDQSLSLDELGFLLWSTQGVKGVIGPGCTLRTVPSAGCRHAFETYLLVNRIEQLPNGIYRYLPLEHALVAEQRNIDIRQRLTQATLGQAFIASAPVTFVWTVIPYRMEWRYLTAAHRVILLDAGHLCQNLYLACEAIGCGTCAIAAYRQEDLDRFLGLDGEEELVVYLAPVGKVEETQGR